MAMPTASMRREISPQFFQKRNTRRFFMVFWRCALRGALLDLRGPVELAVVVVVAVVGRDETQLAIALQELGTGLEDSAAFRVVGHIDQGSPDARHLVR